MCSDQKPMVSIWCLTYNHQDFIRQCLDGFVMQKTDFKFEAIVHDDASTDGTAAIVHEYAEKYPEIIKPIYETDNQYSKNDGSLERLFYEKCTGKYVALCEGDDCWTDPLKLQKQVNFLEANIDFVCSYSSYSTVNKEGSPILWKDSESNKNRSFTGDVFRALLQDNFVQTLTVVFRRDAISVNKNLQYCFDYTMYLRLALSGRFYYIPENTGAYRINPNGVMRTGGLDGVDFLEIKLYFLQEYFRGKNCKRGKEEDRKIIDFLVNYCCGLRYYWKYRAYFINIIKSRPSILLLLPKGVYESQRRKRNGWR